MQITKAQAKKLKYLGSSQSESKYTNIQTDKGKVKHREFPWIEVAYNESVGDNGIREISDITVCGRPYDGTIDNLISLMEMGNPLIGLTASGIALKDLDDVTINSVQVTQEETGATNIDVNAQYKPAIKELKIETEILPISDEPKTLQEAVAQSVVDGIHNDFEKVVSTPNADASEALVETAENIISDALPNDSEVKATVVDKNDNTAKLEVDVKIPAEVVVEEKEPEEKIEPPKEQPKKLNRVQLLDLRMKCATARLAEKYYEPPKTPLATLIKNYPEASMKLNEIFATDGIKPYTISEESLKEAYPYEYNLFIDG